MNLNINPIAEGEYTTIFADGSIIYYNPWIMFNDGTGKWYWNEECRGGVIHWFKPEQKYKFHDWYKIPDVELYGLIAAEKMYEACEKYLDEEDINKAKFIYLTDNNCCSFREFVDKELEDYYNSYKIKE